MVSRISQPWDRIHERMAYWNVSSSTRTDAMHSWIKYGQFSYPRWHWCLSRKCGMGHPLYLSHGTPSQPRCSNFWTRYALRHSVHSRLAQIGDRRQLLTDCGNQQENAKRIDYDYKVGDKVLVINEGSSIKQSPHMAKSHGLSLQFIRMNYQYSIWNQNGMT